VFIDECAVRGCIIGADSDSSNAPRREGIAQITEVAGLPGARRGIIFGVEEQDDRPLLRGKREWLAVLVIQGEIRHFSTYFDERHVSAYARQ
jgi:hypothetical protein